MGYGNLVVAVTHKAELNPAPFGIQETPKGIKKNFEW
jgi:hypothetical protein